MTVEYDIDYYPAPDPPLIEGEILDFDPMDVIEEDLVETGDDQRVAVDQGPADVQATPVVEKSMAPVRPETPIPAETTTNDPHLELSPLSELTSLDSSPTSRETPLPDTPPAPSLRDRNNNWSDHLPMNVLPTRLRSGTHQIADPPTAEEMHYLRIQGESDYDFGAEEVAMAAAVASSEGMEPQCIGEILKRADKLQWEAAMKDEISRLQERGTWKVVKKPTGVNVVGSKWVFRIKKDANGHVQSYRARLVAQGFTQVEGVDYFDTYSPVAKLSSIRVILAIAARLDWEIHQIDVRSAYLYGELTDDEVIYTKPPPGWIHVCKDDEVLLLQKAIYGLKQSGLRWYEVLRAILTDIGLVRCEFDHAVFYRQDERGHVVLFAHVDDISIAGSTIVIVLEIKDKLWKRLEITDMGEIHWLLGIEVRRDRERHTISLSQRSYIESIISRLNFDSIKPRSTPLNPSLPLSKADCPKTTAEIGLMAGKPYREAVGSLMYAAVGTRLDIAYAVGQVARFNENPGLPHWRAVEHVFAYLKNTKNLWLVLGSARNKEVVGYTDADGMSNEDCHAISGYAFIIDGGAVSWSSKRQELVTLSTTEAEYVAATHAAKEAIWLRAFISEVFKPFNAPMPLLSDNQSAIALAKSDNYHARTKHIDIRFHFVRYAIAEKKISLTYCPTEEMTADTLMKALPPVKVKHFTSTLGLSVV